jgi:hypothetical protein
MPVANFDRIMKSAPVQMTNGFTVTCLLLAAYTFGFRAGSNSDFQSFFPIGYFMNSASSQLITKVNIFIDLIFISINLSVKIQMNQKVLVAYFKV